MSVFFLQLGLMNISMNFESKCYATVIIISSYKLQISVVRQLLHALWDSILRMEPTCANPSVGSFYVNLSFVNSLKTYLFASESLLLCCYL